MHRAFASVAVLLILLQAGCGVSEQDYLDVMNEQLAAWKEMADILETVTDSKSMADAKAALEERTERYEAIARKAQALPKPSAQMRERLEPQQFYLQTAARRLQGETKRVRALPGGAAFFKHFESRSVGLFSAVQP